MRSKTSWFSLPLFRSNLRRFLPLLFFLTVLAVLALPVGLYAHMTDHTFDYLGKLATPSLLLSNYCYGLGFHLCVALAAASLGAAMLAFSHLHTRRAIQYYASLPLRRANLYCTSYLSGLAIVALPLLVGLLLCLAVGAAQGAFVLPVAEMAGAAFGSLLLFYTISVLSCVLSGHFFGAPLFFLGFNCIIFVLCYGVNALGARFLPGLAWDAMLPGFTSWLTPLSRLRQALGPVYTVLSGKDYYQSLATGFQSLLPVVVYVFAGIVLAVVGCLLYCRRPAETAGELISFRLIRPVCIILSATMLALVGTVLLNDLLFFNTPLSFPILLLLFLCCAALGWYIAEAVIRKTFHVFDRPALLRGGILLAALAVCMLCAKADFLGYVGFLPKADSVSVVTVTCDGSAISPTAEEALALHRTLLDNQSDLTMVGDSNIQVDFHYTLSSGHSVSRRYYVRSTDMAGNTIESPSTLAIAALCGNPAYLLSFYFDAQDPLISTDQITGGEVRINLPDQDSVPYDAPSSSLLTALSADSCATVYTAILADIRAGNGVSPCGYSPAGGPLGDVGIDYSVTPHLVTYGEYSETVSSLSAYLPIYASMTHTLSALKSLGITLPTGATG